MIPLNLISHMRPLSTKYERLLVRFKSKKCIITQALQRNSGSFKMKVVVKHLDLKVKFWSFPA